MPLPRSFICRCSRPIFFGNTFCLGCGAPLGYEPTLGLLVPLAESDTAGVWELPNDAGSGRYLRCTNLNSPSGCNWLLNDQGDGKVLCKACRLERVIPDLSDPANLVPYQRIAIAKRRLVALLIALDLPVCSRVGEDPEHGLAFDFLRSPAGGPPIMTGHENGVVTLNIEEAEDSIRERIRAQMGEPYRTLLGHLRHETGHYYWDRLVQNTEWLEEFRSIFGDERQDYNGALASYYQNGPAVNWQQAYVSAYASAHPWEDWAETWAHFLHMEDTYRTAASFGVDPESSLRLQVDPFEIDSLSASDAAEGSKFLRFINAWTRLTAVMNELSRAMGQQDFYPFVLSRGAVAKLHMIHRVIENLTSETVPIRRDDQRIPPV